MITIVWLWIVAAMLFLGIEVLHRRYAISSGITRKMAHISLALLAAGLPIWLDWRQCLICLLPFVGIIVLSYFLGIFRSIHSVSRKTIGEIMFPVGMVVTLLVAHNDLAIYSMSIMIVAFADPAAELFGKAITSRKIFGLNKTIAGSAAFAIVTCVIIFGYYVSGLVTLALPVMILAIIASTIAEASSPYGLDNLSVPVVTAMVCI